MKKFPWIFISICVILLISLFFRVWGVAFDLPYIYHPDEPTYICILQNIFKTGDLNPHFFNYPSLFFYINAVMYIPYFLLGKLAGVFAIRSDIAEPITLAAGVTLSPVPSSVLLSRMVTILFGVATVVLVYAIARQMTGDVKTGVFAALLLAIYPTSVNLSRYITPDTFLTFFASASVFFSLLVLKQGKLRYYILAGISIGLATSCKYNGAVIGLALLLAHVFRHGKASFRAWGIYVSILCIAATFLATTPYALLDFSKFMADVKFESIHYASGHFGMEGNTLIWYLTFLWQNGSIIFILAMAAIIYAFFHRSKEIILLSVTALAYFGFISSFAVRNDRTILPLIPFLLILAASFLGRILEKSRELRLINARKAATLILTCVSITAVILPLNTTIEDAFYLTRRDNREIARRWIVETLPRGSKIAIEAFSPFINPALFSIEGYLRIIDHDLKWYKENQFDYLVFSQGMYGRFFKEPERYPTQIKKYEAFFTQVDLVKKFPDKNFEILVYKLE